MRTTVIIKLGWLNFLKNIATFEWRKTSMNNLPMLVALNSIKEFHVFIDASNYVVGARLAQNMDNTIDHPI